jgi:hypothetical protein
MHVTDDFASTVAVTIPILMLAGTVELRDLADAVANRTTSVAHAAAVSLLQFMKQLAQLQVSGQGRVSGFIASLRATLAGLSPTLATTIWLLPFLWLGVLLLAVLCELWCLLFLAGVAFGGAAALAICSVVVVGGLMLLLIGTPAVRTLYVAPQAGLQKFVAGLREDAEKDVFEGMLEAVTAAVQAGWIDPESGKRTAEILETILRGSGSSVAAAQMSEGGAAHLDPAAAADAADPSAAEEADPSSDPGVESAVHRAVTSAREPGA